MPLLDSFDIHFYTQGQNAADCLAMPRMFWDPNLGQQYTASQLWDIYNGYYPDGQGFFTDWYPPQVIPRVLTAHRHRLRPPASRSPGFSISEYNFGCETTIAGGVAEADGLGIFGREGLYASTVWPLQSLTGNYLPPAFDLYRNYDGNGSTVGDLAAAATTSDAVNTSVYAFTHTGNATSSSWWPSTRTRRQRPRPSPSPTPRPSPPSPRTIWSTATPRSSRSPTPPA